MKILGIFDTIDWDSHKYHDEETYTAVHDSGERLLINGKLISNLLEEFCKVSKIPVILHTSFNDNGEPIVETPEDAIKSFLNLNKPKHRLFDY